MMPSRPKVVREPLNRDENTLTLPKPEPIEESTARRILASGIEKVHGPPPIRGWALVFVAFMASGLVAVAYSMAAVG